MLFIFCRLLVALYHFFRVQQMKFNFILDTFYQTGIIEHDRAIHALYYINIVMDNKLQRGHVDVELKIDPKLERYCKSSTLRRGTILDIIVLIFALVISKLYIFSVLKVMKLLKVCKQ